MSTVYTGSADVGGNASNISISLSGVTAPVVKGRDGDATATVTNNTNCSISVTIFGDGSEIETIDVNSGSSSFGTDFTFTVPSDAGSSYDVTAEATRNGNTVASASKTIQTETISDLISINSASFSGKKVGGKEVSGTVTVQNDDSKQQTVTIFADGTEVGSSSIFSGSSSDIDITPQLPEVSEQEEVDIELEAKVNGETVSSTVKTLTVKDITKFVSITGKNLPDKTKSGEEVSGFDQYVTVNSELEDITVNINYQGSSVGSNEFTFSGSEDIGVTLTMPEVDGKEQHTVNLAAVVDGEQADTISHTFTVQSPAALVQIDSVSTPSEGIGGDSITVTTSITNGANDEQKVTLKQGGQKVGSKSIMGGRSSDIEFTAQLPEVESVKDVNISVDAVVGGTVVGNGTSTITVKNIAELVELQSVSSPNKLLSGETGTVDVNITNNSDREVPIDIKTGGSVVASGNINSSGTSTVSFDYEAPDVSNKKDITLDITALTEGITAGTGTTTITIQSPTQFVSISELDVPATIEGGKSGDVTATLTNSHSTTIEGSVQYDGSVVNTKNVRSSVDADFNFVFETQEVEEKTQKEINVLAIVNGDVADQATKTVDVKPKDDNQEGVINNHININTEEGTVSVKSSYTTEVSISGQARGVGIELGENLNTTRPLGILPGSAIERFKGNVPPETKINAVTFDTLAYLKAETSEVFVWTIDGEKSGKGNSFEKRFIRE